MSERQRSSGAEPPWSDLANSLRGSLLRPDPRTFPLGEHVDSASVSPPRPDHSSSTWTPSKGHTPITLYEEHQPADLHGNRASVWKNASPKQQTGSPLTPPVPFNQTNSADRPETKPRSLLRDEEEEASKAPRQRSQAGPGLEGHVRRSFPAPLLPHAAHRSMVGSVIRSTERPRGTLSLLLLLDPSCTRSRAQHFHFITSPRRGGGALIYFLL